LKSSLTDLFVGKSTRTAGAKRRGAEAARQPVSAGVSSRRRTALAARRHGADQDAKTRMTWNATSAWSLTPSCASVNTWQKRRRRLAGVDDLVISLSAKGLTHGEIAAHLAEVYGAEVSKQTISTITDRVMDGMAEWQSRPLDPAYPVLFINAINVKIRDGQVVNRPVYVALAVTVDGTRDILGLWAGEHGDGEGAKYWLRVLTEIKNRGTKDCLIVVCDGLTGLPDAVAAVWPQTIVQTCVVHLLRNSFR